MRRKRKPGKPVGGGGARHPASLANLRRGVTVAPPGNDRALTHGFRSDALTKDVEREVAELQQALADAAPVRDPDGSLPVADTVAVEAAARALKRYRHVSGWCDLHGRVDDKGEVKAAAHYEVTAENQLHRALDSLGMNPAARSKLGLNIARAGAAFDLAQAMAAEADAEAEAEDG
jgi:hypothetical protein